MNAKALLPCLLVAQAAMGGIDTLVNHEWLAKLPRRPSARRELGLHSVREATYGALFVGLGWFAWQGALALFGASSFAWSVRDLLAWRRLSRVVASGAPAAG